MMYRVTNINISDADMITTIVTIDMVMAYTTGVMTGQTIDIKINERHTTHIG